MNNYMYFSELGCYAIYIFIIIINKTLFKLRHAQKAKAYQGQQKIHTLYTQQADTVNNNNKIQMKL